MAIAVPGTAVTFQLNSGLYKISQLEVFNYPQILAFVFEKNNPNQLTGPDIIMGAKPGLKGCRKLGLQT